MATDKKILLKGVRFLAFALPMLFVGPLVIQSSFRNQNNSFFFVVLFLGILCCAFGMYCIFKGITTMVKSFFND